MTRAIDDPHGPASIDEPNQKTAKYPNVVYSNVQLPLVSAATLTDHYGIDAPVDPGLTGKPFLSVLLRLTELKDGYLGSMAV